MKVKVYDLTIYETALHLQQQVATTITEAFVPELNLFVNGFKVFLYDPVLREVPEDADEIEVEGREEEVLRELAAQCSRYEALHSAVVGMLLDRGDRDQGFQGPPSGLQLMN